MPAVGVDETPHSHPRKTNENVAAVTKEVTLHPKEGGRGEGGGGWSVTIEEGERKKNNKKDLTVQ